MLSPHIRKEQSTELEAILVAAVDHPNIVKTIKVLVAHGPEHKLQGQLQADNGRQDEVRFGVVVNYFLVPRRGWCWMWAGRLAGM